MTYAEAKQMQETLWQRMTSLGENLNTFPKGPMGLTPDTVKASPEFKLAKRNFNQAFEQLRMFNKFYLKTFKAEIKADRR